MKILMVNNITYFSVFTKIDEKGNEVVLEELYTPEQLTNIIDVTPEQEYSLGRTKQYVDGEFIDYTPLSVYQKEKKEIEEWFKFYDNQVSQYNRAERLLIPYDEKYGSIKELDALAVEKAKRINEINEILKTEYGIE